jgi:hypothetical protein
MCLLQTELNLLGNVALCWTVVWKIFPVVESLDPDKQVRFACQRRSYVLAVRMMSLGAVQHLQDASIPSVIAHVTLTSAVHTQLLVNLRDMRGIMTGEVLDTGCSAVKARLGPALFTKMELGAYPLHRSCLVYRAYEIECTLCGGKEPIKNPPKYM